MVIDGNGTKKKKKHFSNESSAEISRDSLSLENFTTTGLIYHTHSIPSVVTQM